MFDDDLIMDYLVFFLDIDICLHTNQKNLLGATFVANGLQQSIVYK